MLDNSPANPQKIWQSQKNEETRMTLELLRQRVHDLNARRRRDLLATVIVAVIVLGISAFGIMRTHSLGLQIVFVLSSTWALAGLYFVKRGSRSAEMVDDSTLQTGLEFYRLQIRQNLAIFTRTLPWTIGPAILSILALVAVFAGMAQSQNQPLSKIAPFCTLFILWLIAAPMMRSRKRRELRRELDLLDSLEGAKKT
jgi:uncharacterized membrane protein